MGVLPDTLTSELAGCPAVRKIPAVAPPREPPRHTDRRIRRVAWGRTAGPHEKSNVASCSFTLEPACNLQERLPHRLFLRWLPRGSPPIHHHWSGRESYGRSARLGVTPKPLFNGSDAPLGTKLRRKVLGAVRATLKPLFNGSGCPPPRGTIQLPVGVLRWQRHRRGDPLPPLGFVISVCQKPWPGTERWQLYYPAPYCSFEGEVSTHTSELAD